MLKCIAYLFVRGLNKGTAYSLDELLELLSNSYRSQTVAYSTQNEAVTGKTRKIQVVPFALSHVANWVEWFDNNKILEPVVGYMDRKEHSIHQFKFEKHSAGVWWYARQFSNHAAEVNPDSDGTDVSVTIKAGKEVFTGPGYSHKYWPTQHLFIKAGKFDNVKGIIRINIIYISIIHFNIYINIFLRCSRSFPSLSKKNGYQCFAESCTTTRQGQQGKLG